MAIVRDTCTMVPSGPAHSTVGEDLLYHTLKEEYLSIAAPTLSLEELLCALLGLWHVQGSLGARAVSPRVVCRKRKVHAHMHTLTACSLQSKRCQHGTNSPLTFPQGFAGRPQERCKLLRLGPDVAQAEMGSLHCFRGAGPQLPQGRSACTA